MPVQTRAAHIAFLLTTPDSTEAAWNATGWPGGSLRSLLH